MLSEPFPGIHTNGKHTAKNFLHVGIKQVWIEKRVVQEMDTYLKGLISNNKPDTYYLIMFTQPTSFCVSFLLLPSKLEVCVCFFLSNIFIFHFYACLAIFWKCFPCSACDSILHYVLLNPTLNAPIVFFTHLIHFLCGFYYLLLYL